MNLFVPRPARVASLGLAFMLSVTGLACRPENDVEPGAPVLKKLIIVQMTPFGPSPTTILPDTGDCEASVTDGTACDPQMQSLCRQASAMNWCSCAGTDPMDPAVGAFSCPPFTNVGSVIAVFDRLLDTTPFTDPDGMPMAISTAATAMDMGGTAIPLVSDYASNGAEPGLVFPLYGQFLFGNFRQDGPSVFAAPEGAFTSGTAVTVSLNKTVVQAKDKQTAFTGEGLLQDGVITFTTAPFAGELAAPDPMAPDPNAVTASFTNFIDPAAVGMHTTATANGSAVDITTATTNGTDLVISPAMPWPSGSTVVVTIDATATDLAGQMLGAPVTLTFMAP